MLGAPAHRGAERPSDRNRQQRRGGVGPVVDALVLDAGRATTAAHKLERIDL